jgi:uncharacterized protein YndB with AHSA1/START domain
MSDVSKQLFRVTINASLQDVWDVLTKEGEPLPFFFGSVLHTTGLKPGAPIRMRTPDNKYTGVVGEVLEFDPPHRYAHTFKFTNLDDPPCKVTYELKKVDAGVELTLISEQIPAGTKTEKYMADGGKFITETLKSIVETGKPSTKSRLILLMCRLTQWMTPKNCLSENWPLDQRSAQLFDGDG